MIILNQKKKETNVSDMYIYCSIIVRKKVSNGIKKTKQRKIKPPLFLKQQKQPSTKKTYHHSIESVISPITTSSDEAGSDAKRATVILETAKERRERERIDLSIRDILFCLFLYNEWSV